MASDNVQGLETLEAWKKSKDLALKVYRTVLPVLPADERWNLNQQIRRSVSSIAANIAEGHGRFYYQENVRFCYIARGSLTETYSHLRLAHELGYVASENYVDLKKDVEELVRIINGYIAYLKRAKIGENEPGANRVVREEISPYMPEYPDDPEASERQ